MGLRAKSRLKELQGLRKYCRDQFSVGIVESEIKFLQELIDTEVEKNADAYVQTYVGLNREEIRRAYVEGQNHILNKL